MTLGRILLALALPGLLLRAGEVPVTGKAEPALASIDALMVSFLQRNRIPGAAVAIARQGKLVYARGFGWADVAARRQVEPGSLFRIASLTKAFTAATVLRLAQDGRLDLQDHPFPALAPVTADPRLASITVWHLLHHSGGFDRERSFDPALYTLEIARSLKVPPPVNTAQVIQYMTSRPLEFDPGTQESYSNFGYLVLGRVIERTGGRPYEEAVRTAVLQPLGITDMRLGRTFPEFRAPGEVSYYSARNPKSGPSAFGEGLRPFPYGVWCLESMDAFAGWLATPVDLVRFASALDQPSAVLGPQALARMFARPEGTGYNPDGSEKDPYKACGWYARKAEGGRLETYHRGLLDGTSTLLVRDGAGTDWAVFFNSDTDSHGRELTAVLDPLLDKAIHEIQAWPAEDRFGEFLGQISPSDEVSHD